MKAKCKIKLRIYLAITCTALTGRLVGWFGFNGTFTQHCDITPYKQYHTHTKISSTTRKLTRITVIYHRL